MVRAHPVHGAARARAVDEQQLHGLTAPGQAPQRPAQVQPTSQLALGARRLGVPTHAPQAGHGGERDERRPARVLEQQPVRPHVAQLARHAPGAEQGQLQVRALGGAEPVDDPQLAVLPPRPDAHLREQRSGLRRLGLGLQVVEQLLPPHRPTMAPPHRLCNLG